MKKRKKTVSVRVPLKRIASKEVISRIEDLVRKISPLVEDVYSFIRLYLIHSYSLSREVDVSEDFVKSVISVLSTVSRAGNPKESNRKMRIELSEFYESEYRTIIPHQKVDMSGLGQLVNYLATQIVTSANNNIMNHYETRMRTFLRLYLLQKDNREGLTKTEEKKRIKEIGREVYSTVNTIMRGDSSGIISEWFDLHKDKIYLPRDGDLTLEEDLEKTPGKYLYSTFYLCQKIEEYTLTNEKNRPKLQQFFPQRNSLIPKSVCIDTKILLNMVKFRGKNTDGYTDEFKRSLWGKYFNLPDRVFRKKDHSFSYVIYTDGVSCSLVFAHNEKLASGKQYENYIDKLSSREIEEKYPGRTLLEEVNRDLPKSKQLKKLASRDIEEEYPRTYNRLLKMKCEQLTKGKVLLSADPGKHYLLYMTNGKKYLKYSKNQRDYEGGVVRNRKIQTEILSSSGAKKEEVKLSSSSPKTTDYEKYKDWLRRKYEVSTKVRKVYTLPIMRKMRLRTSIGKRRSEDEFLKRINEKFGKEGKKTMVVLGDWSRSQLRNSPPSLGVGLRKILRRKYEVHLVREYNTSKLCYRCGEPVRNVELKKGECYRLLSCDKCDCQKGEKNVSYLEKNAGSRGSKNLPLSTFFPRDKNGCMNMMNVMKNILTGAGRGRIYTSKGNHSQCVKQSSSEEEKTVVLR